MTDWLVDPGRKYGASIAAPQKATPDATATTELAPVPVHGAGGLLNPNHPMFWFGVIAAGAVGCMAYSTIVKI
jgi:hypothetical protein